MRLGLFDTIRDFLGMQMRKNKTKKYTRYMIKKYNKTLRKLSYE